MTEFDPHSELTVWLDRAQRRGERHALALLGGGDGWEAGLDADTLADVLRHGDRVWMWPGAPDRIVLLLTGVGDLPTAADVVRRLITHLGQPRPYAGVTLLQPGEGVDSLLRRAEGACLLASDGGAGYVATSPVVGPQGP